jgi:hypothetical protein
MQGRGRSTEGTDIWTYWFGSKRAPIDPDEISASQRKEIYRAVAATEKIFGLPFLNKTINLSLRIRALVKIFPSAIFIQIHRNPIDIAQSIYKIRSKKPEQEYFGAMPKECENRQGKSVLQQVCEQVYNIEKNIAFEKSVVGEKRFLSISYKNICQNPTAVLLKVADFMNNNNAPVRICNPVPDNFMLSSGRKIDKDSYSTICDLLENLYGKANLLKSIEK